MQDHLSELSRKYREEMLRMYGKKTVQEIAPPPEPTLHANPNADVPPEPELYANPNADAPPEPELYADPNADFAPSEPMVTPAAEMQEQPVIEPEDNPDFTGQDGDYRNMVETPFPEEFEEPVIPNYIRNGMPPVMEQDAADDMQDLTDSGLLRVATLTGDGAFPVPGAHITVSVRRNGKERFAYLLLTDESGETPTVSLPAPPASLSQQPGSEQPFTVVDIRVFARGFFRAEMLNVPVFAGVTSLQTFQLIPLPILMHEDQEVLSVPTESPDL